MEKLIRGMDLEGEDSAAGRNAFCSFSVLVRKGHAECGDSAFVFAGKDRLAACVLDGVSGEPGASFASSDAAAAILESLKGARGPDKEAIDEAFTKAHLAVRIGYTTASALMLMADGSFIIASIGDSPVYSIDRGGNLDIELPLARVVKDGDSILKFFNFRNMITSVLGGGAELSVAIRKGKMEKGDVLLLATDGVSDNLYVKTGGGYVTDCSGREDLSAIIGSERSPKKILSRVIKAVDARLKGGRVEGNGRLLVPKEDDIAIIAVLRS